MTWTNGFDLFSRRLRIQTMVDYRGGHLWYNNTERIRCVSRQNCNGLQSSGASFEEQAMVVATRNHPSASLDGFLQKGDFARFREASIQYSLSPALSQRLFKSRAVSFLFTGRNLARWTEYRGSTPATRPPPVPQVATSRASDSHLLRSPVSTSTANAYQRRTHMHHTSLGGRLRGPLRPSRLPPLPRAAASPIRCSRPPTRTS